MKKHERLSLFGTLLCVLVGIINICLLAGWIEAERNIRLFVVYPLLLVLLICSAAMWFFSSRLKKSEK